MHVHTLGVSTIVIGDTAIGAERPTIFAFLLLLAVAHPRRLARATIATDLWPAATPPQRNHRLRTLLYRCRQLGAPIACDETVLALSHAPIVDFREYSTLPRSITDIRARAGAVRPVLPGLEAMRLANVGDRLDDARTLIVATLTQWTNAAMLLARSAGEWDLVEQLARAARTVDQLNERAWLNLAEAQCVRGNRVQALETLDEYLTFIAEHDDAAFIPARDLRHRIIAESKWRATADPDVMPSALMRPIWTALGRARRGRGGALLVWGPAGLGKTRLLDEVERAGTAAGSYVARVTVRPVHCLRRVGLLADLVAQLIDVPGAVGCDPDAYGRLRSAAEPDDEQMFHDFTELLTALTEESPLAVAIDDADVLDAESWSFWRALIRWSADRRVLWLFAFRAMHESELRSLPDRTLLPRLPLAALDLGQTRHTGLAFERTGGNPLLLRAAAEPFDVELGARAEAAIDDTLSRLTSDALAIMAAVVSSTGIRVRDLARMLPQTPLQLRATLAELLRAGMIHESDGVIHAYACWAQALLASYPMSSPPMSAAMMAF